MIHRTVASPIGDLLLIGDGTTLAGLYTAGQHWPPVEDRGDRDDNAFGSVATQLEEYFAGTRTEFDVPLAPHGTEFQQRVWSQLRAIPYARTATYGDVAERLGRPSSSRAVGAANGRNPISIIVPCHRVIGASGALTGYAGGLEAKRWLLEHEARVAAEQLTSC